MDDPRSENEGPYARWNRLERYPRRCNGRAQQEDASLQQREGAWVSARFQQSVPADVNDRGEQDKYDGVCGQLSLCVNGMAPAQAAGDGSFSLGHFIRHRVKKLCLVNRIRG